MVRAGEGAGASLQTARIGNAVHKEVIALLNLAARPASAGSVRFGELFMFPRPTGGGTQMIISVVGTLPPAPPTLKISIYRFSSAFSI